MDVLVVAVAIAIPVAVVLRAVGAVRGTRSSRGAWLGVALATAAALSLGVPYVYVEYGRDDAPPPFAFAPVDDATTRTTAARRPVDRSAAGLAPPGDVLTGLTLPFVPPAPGTAITVPSADTSTTRVPSEVEGRWVVGRGSAAGYRVEERILAQPATTVGRTDKVTGEMVVTGTVVESASFVVDMNAVETGNPQRDAQYRGRIMDTGRYSTSRLVLTQPIELGAVPAVGEVIARTATGTFTIRGTSRPVTFDLQARRVRNRIEVLGTIPVRWQDYGIPDPSNGIARVADHGVIEFLVYFDRAA